MEQIKYFKEKYRPQYHYTAETKWLNDPNGLVYHKGKYHLFHQYNCWSHVHWGHAISDDLIHWQHLDNALKPIYREDGTIGQPWSGCVVIDKNNTSGLKTGEKDVFIALYTNADQPGDYQSQYLAYSNDEGITWDLYPKNPVLDEPEFHDFSDPKVFWHKETEKWIMILAAGDIVKLYSSKNLINWIFLSNFGKNQNAHEGVWECPDLFQVSTNTSEKKWVLTISLGSHGMRYFVGEFDGTHFHSHKGNTGAKVVDFGNDFYAAVTWNSDWEEDKDIYWLAWMNSWEYADSMPTMPFQGQMSLVRRISLKKENDQYIMYQEPVLSEKILDKFSLKERNVSINNNNPKIISSLSNTYEFSTIIDRENQKGILSINLCKGKNGGLQILIDFDQDTITMDRSQSGEIPHELFNRNNKLVFEKSEKVKIQAFIDTSSIELFINEGKYVMSNQFFPEQNDRQIELITQDYIELEEVSIRNISSIWETKGNYLPYRILGGEWGIVAGKMEGAASNEGVVLFPEIIKDGLIKANLNYKKYKEQTGIGIVFRCKEDFSTGYLLEINKKANMFRLVKIGHGGKELAKKEIVNDIGYAYDLEIKCNGTAIDVQLGDQKLIAINDLSYNSGLCGIYVFNSVVNVENFHVLPI